MTDNEFSELKRKINALEEVMKQAICQVIRILPQSIRPRLPIFLKTFSLYQAMESLCCSRNLRLK